MLLSVVAVRVIGEYRLRLTFNNGIVKEIDFAKHWGKLSGPIFQPLRDRVFFSQVTLPPDSETIEWPNGADLAAEFLYEIGEPVTTVQTTVMVA
jgi:hypothetical protein